MFGLKMIPRRSPRACLKKEMIERYGLLVTRDPDGAVARTGKSSVWGDLCSAKMLACRVNGFSCGILFQYTSAGNYSDVFGSTEISPSVSGLKGHSGRVENRLKTDLEAMKMLQNLGMLYPCMKGIWNRSLPR